MRYPALAHVILCSTSLQIAYLICELNSTIEVFNLRWWSIWTPANHLHFTRRLSEFNGTAAIRLSADGRFLYGSNRGHNSIAVCKVAGDGTLELVEFVPTNGKIHVILILHQINSILSQYQDSDNATVFKRDPETGKLTELSHDFFVPEGVCVAFTH